MGKYIMSVYIEVYVNCYGCFKRELGIYEKGLIF